MAKLEVGQKILLEHFGDDREATVTKVGRKYADVVFTDWNGRKNEDVRVEMESSSASYHGSRHGVFRWYLDAEDRKAKLEQAALERSADKAWDAFSAAVRNRYSRPEGGTLEAIHQAAALLGISMPDATEGPHG